MAWVLLLSVLVLSLTTVYFGVVLNKWNREFYNSLETKNYEDFLDLLRYYCFIIAVYIVVVVYRAYLRQSLEMRWRLWLTREYLGQWFTDQVYYRLEQDARGTDNPDQRIADDLGTFASTTLALTRHLESIEEQRLSSVFAILGLLSRQHFRFRSI